MLLQLLVMFTAEKEVMDQTVSQVMDIKLNLQNYILENVEHCGGEPEQAETGYYVIDR